jgi:ribonuclease BN (tRNA processing enzyme)
MTVNLQFLGSGSAFVPITENFHSNMVIKSDDGGCLMIDCGSDARHSSAAQGLSFRDIDGVYISHLHADHVGGLEWLAFTNYFSVPSRKVKLYVHPSLIDRLWNNVLSGGLQSLEGARPACLADFYEVMPITADEQFTWNNINFQMIKTVHSCNGGALAPSYGLFFSTKNKTVFITTDTRFEPEQYNNYFEQADMIFHDCDVGPHKSAVHAHFSELITLPEAIKSKMWLYHCSSMKDINPVEHGFQGFAQRGQEFGL